MTVAPPAPPSPRPRRIATPSWLDPRLALGVLLVLASVLIGAKIVSGAKRTYPSVAATRGLAAGTVVTADDVRVTQVQLPNHGKGVYLSRERDVVGKQLRRALAAGELVPVAAVGNPPPQTTVTVPLATGAAPDLRRGQRIEVWASTKACSSVVLLPDVTVQSVHADTGGSFSSGDGGQDVVISVAPALADRVVQALVIEDVQLRAGVLTGNRSDPPASPSADLAACATPSTGR